MRFLQLPSITALICVVGPVTVLAADRNDAGKLLNRMPLSFERNAGQVEAGSAAWVGRANGYRVALDATGATILPAAAERAGVVRMEFVSAHPQATARPLDPLPGKANYLVGRDPKGWIQNLETYGRVEYDNVYEGVDVAWYGNQGQLEYDFLVRPGADPNRIRVRFEGAEKVALEANGDVRIETASGAMKLRLPEVYQEFAGERKRVAGRYLLRTANEIGFELAAYDKAKPLVIDPTLVYGTYFGTGLYTPALAIATNAQGNVYLGGSVDQAGSLPVVNAAQTGVLGFRNAFVIKFDPTGTTVLYSTYVGGSRYDWLSGLTVDASGEAIATGSSLSPDFPLVNPVQSHGDATYGVVFAFKLSAGGGALVYSTYLGPPNSYGVAAATDGAENAYLTGSTATGFTTTPGVYQGTYGGGVSDAFVVKLGAGGQLAYATLLGGASADRGTAIAVDSQGNAYVAGSTRSASFLNSPPGARAGSGGGDDTFIAKLTPDASAVAWLAVMGGSGDDIPAALVRDSASGNLYVAGATTSPDLPTTAGVTQASSNGPEQGFVASIAPDGTTFRFVTYLGGRREDTITGMALTSNGQLLVTGGTTSSSFPMANAIQTAFGGSNVSLYRSGDAGATWTASDTGAPAAVWGLSQDSANPGTILAASGSQFAVFRTTNSGASWSAVSPLTRPIWDIDTRTARFLRTPANPLAVYLYYPYDSAEGAGGEDESFPALGSNDGGATWRALAHPPASPGNGIFLAGMAVSTTDANKIVEIDSGGTVYRSTDGGASFIQVPNAPWLMMPWGTSPLAAGPNGALYLYTYAGFYKSTDFGLTWSSLWGVLSGTPSSFAASPTNPSIIYALLSGQVAKSTDGGATWRMMPSPGFSVAGSNILEVSSSNPQALCASDGVRVSVSTDGGATWSASAPRPAFPSLATAMAVDASGTLYAAGPVDTNVFAAKLGADGKTVAWSTFYSGASGSLPGGVAASPSGDAWIAGTTGSSDLPVTPNAYSTGAYPIAQDCTFGLCVPGGYSSGFLARIADATPACSYTATPSSVVAYSGQTISFVVAAPSGCAWTAAPSDSSWITVTSGGSGTGAGTVGVTLGGNATGSTRTGTVNVNGQPFTITQADASCTYQVTGDTTVPFSGGTIHLTVSAAAGCPWSVTPPSPVVSVVSGGSGTGNGTVTLSLAPNGGVQPLALTLQVGSAPATTLREGSACSYSVTPASFGNAGGSGTMTVTASLAACIWSASSDASWLGVSGNGTGSGSITYHVDANTGGTRTAHAIFSNQRYPPPFEQFAVPITQTVLPLQFVPVAPCRVADTRNANGPFGGPALGAGSPRSFAIPQSACGIPSTAQAYSLNVTVVPPARLSYLTLWPHGQPQAEVSTLNSWDGEVVANAAIVPAGAGGAVDVFVSDTTDVILDVNGYFDTPSPTTTAFYTAAPCRIVDTRMFPVSTFGAPSLPEYGSRNFPIPYSFCGVPGGVSAYSFNVTAVPEGFLAFLTAWPTGQERPFVSTLNSWTGKVVANAAIVPNGTNDSVSIYAYNPTDVILDINGYFAGGGKPGALSFYPITPCRVVDTRNPDGPFTGPILEAGTTRSFAIPAGGCNIPATAAAYAMNVTVVPDGPLWYLTAWPTGAQQPVVSTLNSWDGSVVANAAIIPAAAADGSISVYVAGRTHLVLDINGYFAP